MKLSIPCLLFCLMPLFFVACQPKRQLAKKPIIYIYPTEETEVVVKLDFDGKLIHTYPYYNEEKGWKVKASPDGTLIGSETGKEYYALFWEGINSGYATPETGFVIKGTETAAFLEEKLEILGLSRREANEFIVYWLPEMENNTYNFIHFAQKSYTDGASLDIKPTPETLIRVFMLYKPIKAKQEVAEQSLTPVKRKGFTVVEWGGTELGGSAIN